VSDGSRHEPFCTVLLKGSERIYWYASQKCSELMRRSAMPGSKDNVVHVRGAYGHLRPGRKHCNSELSHD